MISKVCIPIFPPIVNFLLYVLENLTHGKIKCILYVCDTDQVTEEGSIKTPDVIKSDAPAAAAMVDEKPIFSDIHLVSETKIAKEEGIPKDSKIDPDTSTASKQMEDVDSMRKTCNETPTYEAWKTGQVPSPLKRGKSCKTPSPPPAPPEKLKKIASAPSTSRKDSNSIVITPGK